MLVFISYNSKDRQLVETLAEDIDNFGHTIWFDQELTGGHAWWNSILDNILRCDVFVFALTPQALDSHPCRLEYTYAYNLGKRILPVLMADVNTALLSEALSIIQFVDYRQPDKRASIALGRALSALPPARSLPDPLPPAPAVPISSLGKLKERIENEAPMTVEEQASLVLEIKDFLQQPGAEEGARDLMVRFRKRPELFAKIDREISSILGETRERSHPRRSAASSQPAAAPRWPILTAGDLSSARNLFRWSRIRPILWPYVSAAIGTLIFLAPFYATNPDPFVDHLLRSFLLGGAFLLSRIGPDWLRGTLPRIIATIITYLGVTALVWVGAPLSSRDLTSLAAMGIVVGGFMLCSVPFIGDHLWHRLLVGTLIASVCYIPFWSLINDYWNGEPYLTYLGIIGFAAATSGFVYLPEMRFSPQIDARETSGAGER